MPSPVDAPRTSTIDAPRLADVCPLARRSTTIEEEATEPDTLVSVEPATVPAYHHLPESNMNSPHHHLLHPPIQPVKKHADELSTEPEAEREESSACLHTNRGLAAQRSLLCTALAATKLRINSQGNHTEQDDPLAPGGLPSIASMLLRTRPSMDRKRPSTADTSYQSHFAIAAVHHAVEHCDDSAPLDLEMHPSADLSVCCTPRVPIHLGSPRPQTGATTHLMGVEEFREVGAGGSRSGSESAGVSSIARPENADSTEICGVPWRSPMWDAAAKPKPTPRTRTMLRKRADSGIAGALRRDTAGVWPLHWHICCL